MFAEILLLASAFEVGPFYEQRDDDAALRPFWSEEAETTDVLWPVWTSHRDWWRFCFFTHYQENREGGYQFEIMPIWWNGKARAEDETYWGLFPIWGTHPHILLVDDVSYCLWPVWHRYRTHPRELVSNSVLFPFFHWRSDGSWGFWPIYGNSHNRHDDAEYALWPLFTWSAARKARDTAGEGTSFMFFPFYAQVDREREQHWMVIPPLFGYVETPDTWRLRCPWPVVEIERAASRSRTSVFPLYEKVVNYRYFDGAETERIYRYGWRIVELLPDETRVFPFWVSRPDDTYFRLWPLWESHRVAPDVTHSRFLSLFPIRWVDSVDRNWAKFWTFYERETNPVCTSHSLFWGIFRWRTFD